jgi:carbon storage regulator
MRQMMLILTRQQNEKVMLGDDIQVMVIEIIGNKVKMGFTAPANLDIYRDEIYARIQKEKLRPYK